MVGTTIVHVCGIPGSGKTYYCEWLERQQGFLHLDFDQLLQGQGAESKLSLIALLRENPDAFISRLSREGHPTVIDWGFQIQSLPLVRLFRDNGVAIWWFDGDREAARQSFDERATVSREAFQAQMNSIQENWADILTVIGKNVIEVIKAGPTHVAPEWIFDRMFGESSTRT